MNDIIHFIKYTFKWEIRLFLIVSTYTILSLITIEYLHEFSGLFMLTHCFIISFYVLNALIPISSISTNMATYGSFFSGKYLQALPISKLKFIAILNAANIFCLIPMIFTLYWLKFRSAQITNGGTDDFVEKISFFTENSSFILFVIVATFSSLILSQITAVVEVPRKAFNRGNWSNFLLAVTIVVKYLMLVSIFIIVVTISTIQKNLTYYLVFTIVVWIYQAVQSYRYLLNEKLSYWHAKRDVSELAIYFVMLCAFGYILYLIHAKGFFDKESDWKYYYRKGNDIFYDIGSSEWNKVDEKFKSGVSLELTNDYGVSVAHYLAARISNVDNFNEFIISNRESMKQRIVTTRKPVQPLYVDGLTPIHLLAYDNNYELLNNLLKQDYEMLRLEANIGQTPLHYAALNCAQFSTKALVENGGSVSAKDMSGDTPLHLAIRNRCQTVAMYLVFKGANLEEKNNLGETALDVAEKSKASGIEFLLKEIINAHKSQ